MSEHTTESETKITCALMPDGDITRALRDAFPSAIAFYAFGSRMQETHRPDSDLDLAVLVPGYADPLHLWDISGRLEDLAGCAVDLLDFRAATTVMQYQIVMNGRCIWAIQPDAGLYECFVMNEMLKLNEGRAGLLADISRTGTIYG
jgi:uncharacterized protein